MGANLIQAVEVKLLGFFVTNQCVIWQKDQYIYTNKVNNGNKDWTCTKYHKQTNMQIRNLAEIEFSLGILQ